mmetsp:Transcript_95127/g.268758  ORF Transcript_95127/g.268758 Transcript_95127/m.268758 type:complete len:218 (-) Transcript_95127:2750-3403(-)
MYNAWQPCSKTSSLCACRRIASPMASKAPHCAMLSRLCSRTARFKNTAQAPPWISGVLTWKRIVATTRSMPPPSPSVKRSNASSSKVRFHKASIAGRCTASLAWCLSMAVAMASTPPNCTMVWRLSISVKVSVSRAVATSAQTRASPTCSLSSDRSDGIWWPSFSPMALTKTRAWSTPSVGSKGLAENLVPAEPGSSPWPTGCALRKSAFSATNFWT